MSQGFLCVSIHDVAPATLSPCLTLRRQIAESCGAPVTLLVTPAFHRDTRPDARFLAFLDHCLAAGDELALHGYTHLDDSPRAGPLAQRLLREAWTRREGEFSAIGVQEARRRLDLGLAWFARHGWRPTGFVAPAWLLSPGAWQALREAGLRYTTTCGRFHRLDRPGRGEAAPTLFFSTRNAAGRWLSRQRNAWLAAAPGPRLLRFGLHPADAGHPALLQDARAQLRRLASQRQAVTKEVFAGIT